MSNNDVEVNFNYSKEGLLGDASEALLIRNNALYKNVRSKTWSTGFDSHDKNMQYVVGCEDGKRYVQYTQHNVEEVRERCRVQREQNKSNEPLWKLMFPFANYPAMELPKCFVHEISSKYFDNYSWDVIKRDPTMKSQFYQVVNKEYSDFVIHPSGKIPIKIKAPYPKARTG